MVDPIDCAKVRAVLLTDGHWHTVVGRSFRIDPLPLGDPFGVRFAFATSKAGAMIFGPVTSIQAVKTWAR